MLQKILILFYASIVCVSYASAQDTTFSNEYFKLVRTYNSIDEVYQAHPELIPVPPKIVINDDEVLFYNDKHEVINRMPVTKESEIPKDDPNYGKFSGQQKIYKNYKIIDGKLLMILESYGFWDGGHVIAKSACIYNKEGEFITSIKSTHQVKISPDEKYFVTYFTGGRDTIFLYEASGVLKTSSFILDKYSSLDFCENMNLLKVHNSDKGYIETFNFLDNKIIFNYYYRDAIGGVVFNFFIFPDSDNVLISTFPTNKASLVSFDNKIVWNQNCNSIVNCHLIHDNKDLLIHSRDEIMNPDNYFQFIDLIDYSNGFIKTEIICNKILLFSSTLFIIKSGGSYYEYKVL